MTATRAIEGWQGVIALVGITLGAIPLVMTMFGAGRGVWALVLDATGPLRWICPLLVVVAGVVTIAALERRKRSSR